jgi:hypothetical protein
MEIEWYLLECGHYGYTEVGREPEKHPELQLPALACRACPRPEGPDPTLRMFYSGPTLRLIVRRESSAT